ncbi:universal stress protein [Maribius pontilimi]|uniref:Universal stress protein n=1 Tax=Palleronia pontilimi TaxID=1964209 RepID=A0A934IEU0_9RHOB|nr:universal stress protein [Palleronia pontilimi]MBJ3762145.1 universal stress protein [Palleronia pontilimi]
MYHRILIAVAPDHAETLDEMLPVARALRAPDGQIAAVSVVEAMPAYIEVQVPQEIYEGSRTDTHDKLAAALGDDKDVELVVEIGVPAQAILHTQKEGDFDLVILRSHRPAMRDWVLGTTAGRIIRDAPCAVHVIR